ncbi:Carnosine N-methyltransferase [Holothuria leucospilota]|uniref:Carnosine N-methyltransferase n=1 Tax=Holothuria leucospilota TaxID=206669 RepID=A0A9Q1H879_HOLLE|nr:Carnosine N-methyltransferase [Holothuria leucospilota]
MAETIADSFKSKVSEDDQEEALHFARVVAAFRFYRIYSFERVERAEKNFERLSKRHKELIPDFLPHLAELRHCIEHNYEVIKVMLQHTGDMFENRETYTSTNGHEQVTGFDMEKVKTTLKQFVRDWSSEGKAERDACYSPIIREIEELFPRTEIDPDSVAVLVPGAGLGRLAFEIARKGYVSQGNEFSLFMLIASHFVLNRSPCTDCFTVYPWLSNFNNLKCSSDQTRSIKFPDINPSNLPAGSSFTMIAGDFLEVYQTPDCWDCVATCYFIDTAHNIIAYVETIYKILKPGGFWINLGPLLYHFENFPDEPSIELSYETLKRVIKDVGFSMLKEKKDIPSTYLQEPRSMMKYEYDCVFFVCQKPLEDPKSSINNENVS